MEKSAQQGSWSPSDPLASLSFEELAAQQGIAPVEDFEVLIGGPSAEDESVLRNGVVIGATDLTAGSMSGRRETEVDGSSWFAARVSGPPARGVVGSRPMAHTAPIWVLGREPVLVREDIELLIRWLERHWALLEECDNFGSRANRARARALFDEGLKHYRAKLTRASC